LLWPLFLSLILLRKSKIAMFCVLGIPLIVAPLCRVISYLKVSPTAFEFLFQGFSFFNYFDSLAVGCIAAVLLTERKVHIASVLNRLEFKGILLGLVFILVPYILSRLFLAGVFTVPLGNTCQAIGFALLMLQSILCPQLFKPLNWPVITNLGVLSYSIYIWQQVFCSDPKSYGLSNVWFMSFPGWLLAAILVATLSYYGLEKPLMGLRAYFRRSDNPRPNIE
jgi:peptidoglycan/LPS O-acetylase OafA/YrhL